MAKSKTQQLGENGRPEHHKARGRTRNNEEWLTELQGTGFECQAAISDLRDCVLRAIYLCLSRNRSDFAHLDRHEMEQLAEDYAQEILVEILGRLGSFRGDSKFTTWAYSVAINQAISDLCRKRWADTSIDAMREAADGTLRPLLANLEDKTSADPDQRATRDGILTLIRNAIEEEFTERQRIVFLNQYFNGVPPSVLADRFDTSRNNIYRISHDARVKLKKHLAAQSLTEDEVLAAFEEITATGVA